MNDVDFLTRVKNLICDKRHWTRKARARNLLGYRVEINSPLACKWCVIGACDKVAHDLNFEGRDGRDALYDQLEVIRYGGGLALYNDVMGHAKVIELINGAIARLKTKTETK